MLGAFIMEFTRFIRKNKIFTEVISIGGSKVNTANFNYFALFMTIIYIIIGGVLAGAFANTKNETLLYGGLWQALFTFYIRLNNKE